MPQMYDNRQLSRMRQDAIRRSQEMYSRRTAVNSSHYSQGKQHNALTAGNLYESKPSSNTEERGEFCQDNPISLQNGKQTAKGKQNPINSILSVLNSEGKSDTDKLMIIALIVILLREGADIKLIIALAYILL